MTSPFDALGLAEDADERAIKRAYAQRLRLTRPDQDPQGFQALYTAYQAALAQHAAHASAALAGRRPGRNAAIPASIPIDDADAVPREAAPMPEPVKLDFEAFIAELYAVALEGDPANVRDWLQGVPALWSLGLKSALLQPLVQRLAQDQPPMPSVCFDALLVFFDLDHALSGLDPLFVQTLGRRMALRWELSPARRATLAAQLRPLTRRQTDQALRRLERPWRRKSAWLSALVPNRPRLMHNFIGRLCGYRLSELPASIQPRQVAFWLAMGKPGPLSRQQLLLVALRGLALLLPALLLGGISLFFTAAPALDATDSRTPLLWIAGLIGACVGIYWLLMLLRIVVEWQSAAERPGARDTWPRWLFLPALCALTLILRQQLVEPLPAELLALWALMMAINRLRRRAATDPLPFLSNRWWPLLLLGLMRIFTSSHQTIDVSDILLSLTGLCWLADLWLQRATLRRLRPRRPA